MTLLQWNLWGGGILWQPHHMSICLLGLDPTHPANRLKGRLSSLGRWTLVLRREQNWEYSRSPSDRSPHVSPNGRNPFFCLSPHNWSRTSPTDAPWRSNYRSEFMLWYKWYQILRLFPRDIFWKRASRLPIFQMSGPLQGTWNVGQLKDAS